MMSFFSNCLVLAAGTLFIVSPLQSQNVTATVDQTRIGLNETFTLVVEVSGNGGEPKLPDMNAFASLAGTSTSTNIQMVNGRFSQSVSYQYTFFARTAGKFTIGAVEVESNGEVSRTQPIEIEIVAGSTSPAQPQTPQGGAGRGQQPAPSGAPNLEGNLYLEAKLDRSRVYQNEPVIVRYRLYTRLNISSYGISTLPNYSGFWTEDFPMPQQPRTSREVINGQTYLVAEIKKTALFPQSVGRKKLEPLVIECEVQLPRRRSRDIFDQFFDDPFFNRTTRQPVSSRPAEIEVLPLPEDGKPADFSGAVGSFSLTASVDRSLVKTNEAITLKVRASGTGNIKVLPAPQIDLPADFEVYDPKVAENIGHDRDQISGSKTWEYVMVPRFPGSHEIKPITLSYFDPRAKAYKTASTASILLTVEKGAGDFTPVVGGGVSKEDVRLLGQDIRFISTTALPFKNIGEVFYARPLFLSLMGLPVLALLAAFVYQRHQEKLSTNVAYARRRKAGGMAQKQLAAARKLLHKNDEKGFYAEVQRALVGFLGNKLNVAEAGLITDNVERMLAEKQVQAEVIRDYLDCLHTCDFQRFAPAQSNGKAMQDFYEQARRALEAMDKAL
jgi:hypothetical protein